MIRIRCIRALTEDYKLIMVYYPDDLRFVRMIDVYPYFSIGWETAIKSTDFEENHDDVCLPSYYRIDETGKQTEEIINNTEHLGCGLISKRLINELKYKDNIRYQLGTEFLNRLKQNCSIAYYKDALWYYRKRPDQLSQEKEHPLNK